MPTADQLSQAIVKNIGNPALRDRLASHIASNTDLVERCKLLKIDLANITAEDFTRIFTPFAPEESLLMKRLMAEKDALIREYEKKLKITFREDGPPYIVAKEKFEADLLKFGEEHERKSQASLKAKKDVIEQDFQVGLERMVDAQGRTRKVLQAAVESAKKLQARPDNVNSQKQPEMKKAVADRLAELQKFDDEVREKKESRLIFIEQEHNALRGLELGRQKEALRENFEKKYWAEHETRRQQALETSGMNNLSERLKVAEKAFRDYQNLQELKYGLIAFAEKDEQIDAIIGKEFHEEKPPMKKAPLREEPSEAKEEDWRLQEMQNLQDNGDRHKIREYVYIILAKRGIEEKVRQLIGAKAKSLRDEDGLEIDYDFLQKILHPSAELSEVREQLLELLIEDGDFNYPKFEECVQLLKQIQEAETPDLAKDQKFRAKYLEAIDEVSTDLKYMMSLYLLCDEKEGDNMKGNYESYAAALDDLQKEADRISRYAELGFESGKKYPAPKKPADATTVDYVSIDEERTKKAAAKADSPLKWHQDKIAELFEEDTFQIRSELARILSQDDGIRHSVKILSGITRKGSLREGDINAQFLQKILMPNSDPNSDPGFLEIQGRLMENCELYLRGYIGRANKSEGEKRIKNLRSIMAMCLVCHDAAGIYQKAETMLEKLVSQKREESPFPAQEHQSSVVKTSAVIAKKAKEDIRGSQPKPVAKKPKSKGSVIPEWKLDIIEDLEDVVGRGNVEAAIFEIAEKEKGDLQKLFKADRKDCADVTSMEVLRVVLKPREAGSEEEESRNKIMQRAKQCMKSCRDHIRENPDKKERGDKKHAPYLLAAALLIEDELDSAKDIKSRQALCKQAITDLPILEEQKKKASYRFPTGSIRSRKGPKDGFFRDGGFSPFVFMDGQRQGHD